MKVSLSTFCKICYDNAHKTGTKYENSEPVSFCELNEKGVYKIVCPQNHEQLVFLQEQRFQILYDLGALSLSDGYTREAVSSFSTSLERFYEFIIKLFLLKDKFEISVIHDFLNAISKQSERQYGSFLALYINNIGKNPPILSNKWVEFRNKVIHQGIIPSEKKSLEYGQEVVNIICDVLIMLLNKYKNRTNKILSNVYEYNYEINKKEYPTINDIRILSFPSLITLRMINHNNFGKIILADEIKKYRRTDALKRISYIK